MRTGISIGSEGFTAIGRPAASILAQMKVQSVSDESLISEHVEIVHVLLERLVAPHAHKTAITKLFESQSNGELRQCGVPKGQTEEISHLQSRHSQSVGAFVHLMYCTENLLTRICLLSDSTGAKRALLRTSEALKTLKYVLGADSQYLQWPFTVAPRFVSAV
jgi:hypothetical protein